MTKPKYNLRDEVKCTVNAEFSGVKISQEKTFYVTGIDLSSDANGQIILYTIAESMPDAYYPGKGFIHGVLEEKLS